MSKLTIFAPNFALIIDIFLIPVPTSIVFLPDAGPENPFQYQLAKFLRAAGHRVAIGQKKTIGSIFNAIRQHHPDILYFDWVHSFILGKSLWWSYIKSFVFVVEIIFTRYIKKISMVHTLHNLQNHAGLYLGLEKSVYGFFLRNCTKIRVYSETTKKDAVLKFNLDPNKIEVIQDLPFHFYYENKISKEDARKQLGLDKNAFIYLFFGEIKPYKGLQNFLPVFKEKAEKNDILLVAGKSYDADFLNTLQTITAGVEQVKWFHRFIEDSEVQLFFNAADVVVLPFVRIDHSGSIDLAMSFSKPVITLRTPSTEKLLTNQSELLFTNQGGLANCLKVVKTLDLAEIGQQNFKTTDSTNYEEILRLF